MCIQGKFCLPEPIADPIPSLNGSAILGYAPEFLLNTIPVLMITVLIPKFLIDS